MFRNMKSDIQAVFENDPAARNRFEVVFTYSGLHAIWAHRIAHALLQAQVVHARPDHFADEPVSSPASRFIPGRESASACSSITAWASSSGKRARSATTSSFIKA